MFSGSNINPTPNFEDFNRNPNTQFFNHFNPLYNNERKLYDLLVTEAWNKHGVCCTYFIITDDTNYDRIFGEDNNRFVKKSLLNVMFYFELPQEQKQFTLQGIEWTEAFHIYLSKRHFSAITRMQYEEYLPRIGDFIRSEYNDVYFEVMSVKDQEEQFLQGQHSWDLTIRPIRDNHLSLSASPTNNFGSLETYISQPDLFNISEKIEEEKETVNYEPEITECPPGLPDGWW
jgi:hypothetical protein